MLVRRSTVIAAGTLMPVLPLFSAGLSITEQTLERPPARRSAAGAATPGPASDSSGKALALATKRGLIGSHGSNYSYLDEHAATGPVIVYETFSSRTRYKTLTPVIDVQHGDLLIDCTLIRAIEDDGEVSTGSYCRGASPASIEAIEDSISDRWTHAYSSSLPWLGDAAAKADCVHPMGLETKAGRVLRCQEGEDKEVTTNVSTYVFSPTFEVELAMKGFEFAGWTEDKGALLFWRLGENSHHEIKRALR